MEVPSERPRQRILVVDDDENLLSNLAAFLESHGYVPVCVPSTHSALSVIQDGAIDSVVADYRLGNESGVDLIRAIREVTATTPVVLMSAYLDEWIQTLAHSMGRVQCVRKPFSGAEMISAIESGLQNPDQGM